MLLFEWFLKFVTWLTSLFSIGPNYDIFNNITITPSCPLKLSNYSCDSNSRYSSINGKCNNLIKPWIGQAVLPYKRILPALYDDGILLPRSKALSENPLPNPRFLSRYFSPLSFAESIQYDTDASHFLPLFGQFLAHDITNSRASMDEKGNDINCDCSSTNSECISIKMPSTENIMKMTCMKFTRTIASYPTLNCGFKAREQMNSISSFIDATTVYGIDLSRTNQIRLFQGGLLKTSNGAVGHRKYLPLYSNQTCGKTMCFMGGENKTSENMGLSGIQTMFLREHNRIATELAKLNPTWSDEILFQETRKINIALLQHITYNEWLPKILGLKKAQENNLIPLKTDDYFNGYDQNVDATITNEFGSQAFRFGHSLIRNTLNRYDKNNNIMAETLNISKTFFKTQEAFNNSTGGIDAVVIGLVNDAAYVYDNHVAFALQNQLFEINLPDGSIQAIDLFAANINRGRDHGIRPYIYYKEWCGFKKSNTFEELNDTIPGDNIKKLQSIYERVEDVDLYVGGLSEKPIDGAIVGPTFGCIIAKQFSALKKGDRFYYENGPSSTSFTLEQLKEIKKVTASRLICNNFDVDQIQKEAFTLPIFNNPRVLCDDIVKVDLSKWKTS